MFTYLLPRVKTVNGVTSGLGVWLSPIILCRLYIIFKTRQRKLKKKKRKKVSTTEIHMYMPCSDEFHYAASNTCPAAKSGQVCSCKPRVVNQDLHLRHTSTLQQQLFLPLQKRGSSFVAKSRLQLQI